MRKNGSGEVSSIGADYFESFFYRFPVKATKRGVHRYDYRLGSFGSKDFETWKRELNDFRKKIFGLKLKKRLSRNFDLLMLERRIENEIKWIGEEEYKSSPFLYVSTIYDGLIYPAFGSYAPLSVRSRNFVERSNDIENILNYARENLLFSEQVEKQSALERLNIIVNFFDEYTSYLSGKGDIGLKEELKTVKPSVIKNLNDLYSFIEKLPVASNSKKLSFAKKIKREYLEDYPLRELQLDLERRIQETAQMIMQKAREIKISSPFRETLESALFDEKEISLEDIFDLFALIKKNGEKLFGSTELSIEYKRILQDSERKFNSLAKLSNNIIIPPGPFDMHNTIPVMIVTPVSETSILLRLVSLGYPGRAYQSEILRNKTYSFRRTFENALFNEGWEFYVRQSMTELLKKELGPKFELVALYEKYITLFKAFIQNELLNKEISLDQVNFLIEKNELIFNKGEFLYGLIAENGKSLKAIVGLNSIAYFKRKALKKGIKERDFHIKILSASTLPFKFMGQVITR